MAQLGRILALASLAAAAATTPSATELQAQVDAAIAERAGAFTIPAGEYNFSTANFNVSGASSLRLRAEGVKLWFSGTSGMNISNSEDLHVSGLAINCTSCPHGRYGVPGITYNLLNSSDVVSEDITIHQSTFFSVTAFNGGGGHVFRRFHLPAPASRPPGPDPYAHQRDGFHFSDLRRGVTLEDSDGASFGDDFFNAHNSLMLVLRVESPTSLLLINPHVQNVRSGKNTVYGTFCQLENLRAGDELSFFAMQEASLFEAVRPLSGACAVAGAPAQVGDAAVVAEATALAKEVQTNFSTVSLDASDIWRVTFAAPVPATVVAGALVNLDSFSTPGTVIRNNNFSDSRYNIGRFKSSGGAIVNNTFSGAGTKNLEITPLLQYFEGPLPLVRDVVVSGNTIVGEGDAPIHCSPFCSNSCLPHTCSRCDLCEHDAAWTANVTVVGNTIVADPHSAVEHGLQYV